MAILDTLISPVAALIGQVVEKIWPDPEKQAEAQRKLLELIQNGQLAQLTAESGLATLGATTVQTEAKSASWLTATWRPLTMMLFVVIIANNYILYPYINLFFHTGLKLELPPDLWDLLKIGIGGYVTSRGVEKVMTTIADMKTAKT